MTNDASCQTNFQRKIGRPRYYEADHLISALNKHMQSLEKRLEGKQINIENLLQSIQNCSYNNIVIATMKLMRFLLKTSTLLMRKLNRFLTNQIKLMKTTIRIIMTIRR